MFKKVQIILLVLICLATFSFVGCKETPTKQMETPTINATKLELFINDTFMFVVDNYDGVVEWETSNYKIATITEDGLMTCVGLGNVTITAIAGETKLTCNVLCTIDYVSIPKLELDGEVLTNNEYKLTLLLDGADVEYEVTPVLKIDGQEISGVSYTLKSLDESKVGIDGTKVIAKAVTEGTKVTVSCEYQNKTYTVNLFVVVEG